MVRAIQECERGSFETTLFSFPRQTLRDEIEIQDLASFKIFIPKNQIRHLIHYRVLKRCNWWGSTDFENYFDVLIFTDSRDLRITAWVSSYVVIPMTVNDFRDSIGLFSILLNSRFLGNLQRCWRHCFWSPWKLSSVRVGYLRKSLKLHM